VKQPSSIKGLLGIIVTSAVVYQFVRVLTEHTGNFELIFYGVGLVGFLTILIAYNSISHGFVRRVLFYSSLFVHLLGILSAGTLLPERVMLFDGIITIVFAWISLYFGWPKNVFKVIIGLACIIGSYTLFYAMLTKSTSEGSYFLLITCAGLLVLGITLLLNGFNLAIKAIDEH
jgi:hypothetical protein